MPGARFVVVPATISAAWRLDIAFDFHVLLFTFGVALLTAVLIGWLRRWR